MDALYTDGTPFHPILSLDTAHTAQLDWHHHTQDQRDARKRTSDHEPLRRAISHHTVRVCEHKLGACRKDDAHTPTHHPPTQQHARTNGIHTHTPCLNPRLIITFPPHFASCTPRSRTNRAALHSLLGTVGRRGQSERQAGTPWASAHTSSRRPRRCSLRRHDPTQVPVCCSPCFSFLLLRVT